MRKIVFKSFNKKDFVKDWLIPDLQKTIDGNLDTLMTLEVSTEETGKEYPLAYEVIEFIKSLNFMIQYQEYMIADLLASKEKLVKIPLGTLPLESSQFSFEMTMEKQSVTVGDLTLEIIEE